MDIREILSLKRPTHVSHGWLPAVRAWLPTPCRAYRNDQDEIMALAHTIGDDRGTLFACHLDTVHERNGRQRVEPMWGFPDAWMTTNGECLGADDGAGLWLMLELIEAGVPGTYLFHLGEESGCRGSRWMRDRHADWLRRFSRCIGLDRPGATDVITHFVGRRGCGDAFARRLAFHLSSRLDDDYALRPCEGVVRPTSATTSV